MLGEANGATVPRIYSRNKGYKKRRNRISIAEKEVEAKKDRTYALTKQQKDQVTRANIISQAMFSNLGFYQETEKKKKKF